MVQVIWTEPALENLRQIHDCIATDSPRAAQRMVIRLEHAVSILEAFPLRGRSLPEFPASPYREIIEGNYRVVYRYDVDDDSVLIAAIHHGRRRLTSPPEI